MDYVNLFVWCLLFRNSISTMPGYGNGGQIVDGKTYVPMKTEDEWVPPPNHLPSTTASTPFGTLDQWNSEQQTNLNNILKHRLFKPLLNHKLRNSVSVDAAGERALLAKLKTKRNMMAIATVFHHLLGPTFYSDIRNLGYGYYNGLQGWYAATFLQQPHSHATPGNCCSFFSFLCLSFFLFVCLEIFLVFH